MCVASGLQYWLFFEKGKGQAFYYLPYSFLTTSQTPKVRWGRSTKTSKVPTEHEEKTGYLF